MEDTPCPFCDATAPVAGDAGQASDAGRVGDDEGYSAVPVYGAPAYVLVPGGGGSSPLLGGAMMAVAAVTLLRRRRSP